ncbi:hypothetical protein AALO_G00081820 [Alosa alosa]|uniref:Essential MCU regulator, mitochondrial n=1 Tax=Alosa alosa TaxID=278164 RepID=A0AAV6GXF4_9TELE|nr:hypothetical protein AALO_G00081820 [Alosa alosa]
MFMTGSIPLRLLVALLCKRELSALLQISSCTTTRKMASVVYRASRLWASKNVGKLPGLTGFRSPLTTLTPCRSAVSTTTGAILPKPKKTTFGLIRITIMTTMMTELIGYGPM